MPVNYVSSHQLEYAATEVKGKFPGCFVKSTQGFYKKLRKLNDFFLFFPLMTAVSKSVLR